MSIINKFNIFSEFDHKLVDSIKSFYLTKFELLFVTSDDSVYQYNIRKKQLNKVDNFCENQVIIKLDCSNAHFMALTGNGCVYCWGQNNFGQLGDATRIRCDTPKKLNNSLDDQLIVDISCGERHSLVLTRDGVVYAFGDNYSGQCCSNNSTYNQLVPNKVSIANTTRVIAISCGYAHSAALTESGHVFCWGSNSWGQLGINNIDRRHITTQLNVPLIKQIMCGWSYTLMLSIDGDIYFCGQIIGSLSHRIPTKLNSSTTKFIKIAATIQCPLCVALSSDNKCYVFGRYGDKEIKRIVKDLHETNFVSIDETYAYYEQITYKCVNERNDESIEKIITKNLESKIEVTTTEYSKSFEELSLISSGGFSSVFKCEHRVTHQLYAIKKISFEPKTRETVLNELNILSELESNFVVKLVDSWVENNYYLELHSSDSHSQNSDLNQLFYSPLRTELLHIQMELCSLTLRDVINIVIKECLKTSDNTLSLIGYYICSELLYEILECVQYLHQQTPAIIHRDLKPENFLLTQLDDSNKRFVKLSDFGLSTFHESTDQSHTKYIGTRGYKAPELNFNPKYTPKADIYSLGIIILEMFQININDERIESLLPLMSVKSMALSALNATPSFRPHSNQMLAQHNEWRLSREQLSADEEFNEIVLRNPKSNSIDNNFIEYFIQKKFEF